MMPRRVARLHTKVTCACGKVCANALHLAKHHKTCTYNDPKPPLQEPTE